MGQLRRPAKMPTPRPSVSWETFKCFEYFLTASPHGGKPATPTPATHTRCPGKCLHCALMKCVAEMGKAGLVAMDGWMDGGIPRLPFVFAL